MSIKNVPKFQKIGSNDLIVCVGKVEMHKYMQYEVSLYDYAWVGQLIHESKNMAAIYKL